MNSITIITIVVVALLTGIIFWLAWLGYSSCLKEYRLEVKNGLHDKEIKEEFQKKKSKKKLPGLIISWALLGTLLALFVTGCAYKISGDNFTIGNQTALVIKSGSMSDFYNDERAIEYNYDTALHFDVGDICTFKKVSAEEELVEGDVYGYKYKNIIITHRLLSVNDDICKFRGDNNRSIDGSVKREDVIYHYTGKKVPGFGSFVLYAQSYFGLWSLACIVGVAILSEVMLYKITRIHEIRNFILTQDELEAEEIQKNPKFKKYKEKEGKKKNEK